LLQKLRLRANGPALLCVAIVATVADEMPDGGIVVSPQIDIVLEVGATKQDA
jgi:hypothetical protein